MNEDRTFDLYRLLVEEVREARRARREISNVFTTINMGGVGALGFLAGPQNGLPPILIAWGVGALVLTCIIWRMSNAYFTQMLSRKFDLIYEVENELGISPMQREWKGLPRKGPMKWFSLERLMPFLFIFGYLIFLFYKIDWSAAWPSIQQWWSAFAR